MLKGFVTHKVQDNLGHTLGGDCVTLERSSLHRAAPQSVSRVARQTQAMARNIALATLLGPTSGDAVSGKDKFV